MFSCFPCKIIGSHQIVFNCNARTKQNVIFVMIVCGNKFNIHKIEALLLNSSSSSLKYRYPVFLAFSLNPESHIITLNTVLMVSNVGGVCYLIATNSMVILLGVCVHNEVEPCERTRRCQIFNDLEYLYRLIENFFSFNSKNSQT